MRVRAMLFWVVCSLAASGGAQAQQVANPTSSAQVNYRNCLAGRGRRCDLSALSGEQRVTVEGVARQRRVHNYSNCLASTGRGCDRRLLTPGEGAEVARRAKERNYQRCYSGRAGCNLASLTTVQVRDVRRHRPLDFPDPEAPSRFGTQDAAGNSIDSVSTYRNLPPALRSAATAQPTAGCAENGSCYGDVSAATGRAKTVSVRGYYRRDGTYVRGHYRSSPRRH
jgi:hypothetical protein